MPYRPDIDGLRAFAIAAVVLFHAGFANFPGGFIGVDVFFVVSGYLITGLIVDRLRQGEFSFWDFYARRTRRIFPALFTVLLATLIVGFFILTPEEYKALGESAAYSSAFLANVYFWLHTGYFDQPAATMPLLHIWSIGVEEQFYLIWPLTLVLLWRYLGFGRARTLAYLVLATALLALVCIVWTYYDDKSAFFLPFTRLWEFTLGALLLALPSFKHARAADALSVLGIVAMGYAVYAFDEDLSYPGYYALLPCLGTAAVIAAGPASLAGRALSLRPFVFLGKISYSLYLWHWPIIVYYSLHEGTSDLSPWEKITLILVALGITVLSWRFIEQPVRRRRGQPWRHVAYGASVAAAVGGLSLLVGATGGFAGRLPENMRLLADSDAMTELKCPYRARIPELGGRARLCILGKPWTEASKHAVLWGDSHAGHLVSLLDVAAKAQDVSVLFWRACAPFVDDKEVRRRKRVIQGDYSTTCGRKRRQILDFIRATPSVNTVIIANAWPSYQETIYDVDSGQMRLDPAKSLARIKQGLAKAIAEIDPAQHSVLLVGDVPRPRFSVVDCAMQEVLKLWRKPCTQNLNFVNRDDVLKFHQPTEQVLSQLADETDHVYYLNLLKAMCGSEGCPLRIDDEIIYADDNHLRRNLRLKTRNSLASLMRLDQALRQAIDRAPRGEHAEAR